MIVTDFVGIYFFVISEFCISQIYIFRILIVNKKYTHAR